MDRFLALLVVGGSAVAYGVAYGLNGATTRANTQTGSYANWGPGAGLYPGHYGYLYNSTSSFRAISTVDNVSITGFNVVSSNQVSVNLSYSGSGTSPAITIVTIAPGLSGSNALAAGWGSPTTATVSLAGTGSFSSTWHAALLIIPYTGA